MGLVWDLTQVDDQTLAELSAVRSFETVTGKMQIGKTDETKKRIPDLPDPPAETLQHRT